LDGRVSLQDAQKLARHSDPRLTANHYTHLSVSDLSQSVGQLPSIPKPKKKAKATGTDGKASDCRAHCRITSAADCRPMPKSGELGKMEGECPETQNPQNPLKIGI
jgi:hypothetical protein